MGSKVIRSLFLALAIFAVSAASSAQISISVNFGPPALPVYEQPACPGDDYVWTPGYWAWSPDGYYWVPGTWVLAPEPGLLWTPGYWAFDSDQYDWHPGYWGPTVGYYGGIDYGYGYPGNGYYGGYWRDRHFFYNQAVTNVSPERVHYVYRAAVPEHPANRVSFNGGHGGTVVRPTPQQEAAAREHHAAPTAVQVQHERAASTNRQLRASVNAGRPPVAATAKPAEFSGRGVVAASRAGGTYKPPEKRAAPSQPKAAASTPAPAARPGRNEAAPAPPAPSASKRAVPPPADRAPQPERHVRSNNPPPAPEKQVRPEAAPRPQAPPPAATASRREAASPPERAPQARPEKAPPAARPEGRPPEKKGPPNEEEEHRR